MGGSLPSIACCTEADYGSGEVVNEVPVDAGVRVSVRLSTRDALPLTNAFDTEPSAELIASRLETLAARKAGAEEIAREYVRLAWWCYRGDFTAPRSPHPAAAALMARTKQLSLDQIERNVRTLLSTFWEVPVIQGTARDVRKGFVDPLIRAQLTALVGAPAFRLISWRQLQELARIPRSSEDHARTLQEILQEKLDKGEPLLDEKCNPMMQIYMISHTWFRPDNPDKVTDPEKTDAIGIKAKALIEFGKYTAEVFNREVYYWIDYCCIDQDNIQPGIRSLPLYVCSCSSFLVLYSRNYETRAWTLLEQCLFMSIGTKPAMTAISVEPSWFPDMHCDANGNECFKILLDPTAGNLSVEDDRPLIRRLTQISCDSWGTGWIESTGYWGGTEATGGSKGAPKYGPGLAGADALSFGTTEVMVRRMGLLPEGMRVISSHVDGTIKVSLK